jgi:hypothetical protein
LLLKPQLELVGLNHQIHPLDPLRPQPEKQIPPD